MKLGAGMIDDAAKNLLKIRDKVETENTGSPSFLAVVTTNHRKDGVHVIPIGCLKN